MRIIGGTEIEVWRQETSRDRFGDVTRELVGTIENCVFQWASAASVGLRFHNVEDFQENSKLSAVMFIPNDAEVRVQNRDRVVMGDRTFQVQGDRAWDETHPSTGHDFGYYMVQLEMVD